MKRRDSIKTITLGAIGASYLLNGCYGVTQEKIKRSLTRYQYGRTPQEKLYDDRLFNQEFFTDEECAQHVSVAHPKNSLLRG